MPIIFGVTILFLLFGLKPLYTHYMDVSSRADAVKLSRDTKQKTLDDLLVMKQSLENATGTTDFTEKVKKLSRSWSDADIMASIMLNDYTRSIDGIGSPITIPSISLSKGQKLPNWLSLGTAQLVLYGKSIDDIVNFLTYLTSSSPYIYTLNAINLPIVAPIQDDIGWFSLPIGLGIYYYE